MKKIIIFLLLLFTISSISPAYAAPEEVERVSPSVVTILVYKPISSKRFQHVGTGTGFAFTSNGYILTSKHVVYDKKAKYLVLLSNGVEKLADVVYKDPDNDVAIIKIDESFKTIALFGNSSTLEKGQTITAIGNAKGKPTNPYTSGTISGFNRNVTAKGAGLVENLSGLIQTTADIVPGYSGGPLIDAAGNVMGINVAKSASITDLSFAIPIDDVKESVRTFFNTLQ